MIEITPSATSQRHPFLPLLVRKHRWRSLDEPQPTSRDHRHDAEPDLDAGGKPCLATLNPSKPRSTVAPTARKPPLVVLKSP